MQYATLPIRVDKSHLVTIGERLSAESVELIRELVNNAYDADATEVRVWTRDDELRVEDNGLGMDLDGLREYFTIGTSDKRLHPKSPRFGRLRIGQFGIGKFATLSANDSLCSVSEGHLRRKWCLTSRLGRAPEIAGICRCGLFRPIPSAETAQR